MKTKKIIPGCVAIFIFFVFSLGGYYVTRFVSAWSFPWWLHLLLFLTVMEGAYFAGFSLTVRTPFLIRIIEMLLWLIPLYFLNGGLGSELLWTALFLGSAWLIARGYGIQVVRMEKVADYLGDQAASTVSWEYESLVSRGQNQLSIDFFWLRFWFFGVLISILAIVAHNYQPNFGSASHLYLTFLGWGTVSSGLILQGLAYLFRLQILWFHAHVEIEKDLVKIWQRHLLVFALILTVVLGLIPVNYSPVTAERLGGIVMGLCNRFASIPTPSPAIDDSRDYSSELDSPILNQTGEWGWGGLLLGFIYLFVIAVFLVFVLVVLGWVLVSLVRMEIQHLRGLPRLLVLMYQAWQRVWKDLLTWRKSFSLGWQDIFGIPSGKLANSELSESKRVKTLAVPSRDLRAMFRKIVQVGKRSGIVFTTVQTAAEYSQSLKEHFREENDAVDEFFQGYHSERYGRVSLTKVEEQFFLAAGRRIVEQFRILEQEKENEL